MSEKPEVTIYTMQNCPYCSRAKNLLQEHQVPYTELLVDKDDEAQWEALEKRSGMQTMPQIFHGEHLIGGFTELQVLSQKHDGLASLKGKG